MKGDRKALPVTPQSEEKMEMGRGLQPRLNCCGFVPFIAGKYGKLLQSDQIYDKIRKYKERKSGFMTQEKIDRINALARKKKTEGLTEEEAAEQKLLYKEYIAGFRASMTGILDNTVVERPDGTREALTKKS